MSDREWTGVWLSDRPLDGNEGAYGDVLLAVDLDVAGDELGAYEWVEDGKPYREFLVPASLINARGRVRRARPAELGV